MRSPFSLDKPPPERPPVGVLCPSLWPVQVRWWLRHMPDQDGGPCRSCGQQWPCHSWAAWDGQLGDAIARHRQFLRDLAAGAAMPATFTVEEIEAARMALAKWRSARGRRLTTRVSKQRNGKPVLA